jgi:hypothetical protein
MKVGGLALRQMGMHQQLGMLFAVVTDGLNSCSTEDPHTDIWRFAWPVALDVIF